MNQKIMKENEKQMYYFLENIKNLRKCSHLSQAEMARIMGVGIQSLKKIEQGQFPPRLGMDAVFNLESHFNIPAYQLFLPIDF